MSSATLSIDIDREFLRSAVVRGGRVRRFIARAFIGKLERTLSASWTQRPIEVHGVGDELTFQNLDTSAFLSGDRLWLSARLDDDAGIAKLYDGAALLVLHMMERADPQFVTDLVSEPVPAEDLSLVTDERRKADWVGVLERAVELAVASEARTAASLRAIVDFMTNKGATVAIVGDSTALDVAQLEDNSIPAETLLDELLAAERAGRRPRASRAEPSLTPAPTTVARVRRRRRLFDSTRDLPRLMKMLEAIHEVVLLPRAPLDEARLVDAVAAGTAPQERG